MNKTLSLCLIFSWCFFFSNAQNNDHPDRIELRATVIKNQPVKTKEVTLDGGPSSAMDKAFNAYHQVIEQASKQNINAGEYQGITEG